MDDDMTMLAIRLEAETPFKTVGKLEREDWENILLGIKTVSPGAYEQLKKDAIAQAERWQAYQASHT
jgi:hypothetical protein